YRIEWDEALKGFGVRVMASAVKTYIVNYRAASGRHHRMSIGRCNVLSPAQARREAIRILGEVALGGNPLAERRCARCESTFRFLAGEYIKRHAIHKKSRREDERVIRKDLLQSLGNLHLSEINRRGIIRLVNGIKDRGAPIMANRTLTLIRTICNFGIEQAITDVNPSSGIKMPGRERRRDRVLTEREIETFWHRLAHTKIGNSVQTIIKLILITAQRPGEVASAEWSEVDLETGFWTIPAGKSKNELTHRVPFSQMAMKIIVSLDRSSRFLFPSPANHNKHICVNYLGQAVRNNREMLGIEHFTPHDLRRTAASHMAGMGIYRLVISKILNHVESGITAVYDRHGYDREKREALDTWAIKLADILAGNKGTVVPLVHPWIIRETDNCKYYKAM
ncbi:MAG: site-specific integrase, partial [Candidatus Krumholzibacteria bacterium]|nr:site-specific integrase [Candidatus Krumholzibacteria bacterium]